ncbi:RNA polymerase factor sigma-54 [Bacillus sp. FJAT-28004]|uniref:RNA polymerase factor sigma-54 n=1 Tax=Bacillus sp. FJAT-28004 TaxID=1679165 RepID=UPI0006B45FC7|nr:RNA polymerase factor sigma-54 [Bacillus sp. FJAT-28004]
MELSLNGKQEQKLLLTPQMRQSMEVLQMSVWDLSELIKQQSMDNPFIELKPAKDFSGLHQASSTGLDWWLDVDHPNEPALESVLIEQLTYMKLDHTVLVVCRWIIGNLDEKGYLLYDKDEISTLTGTSLRHVDEAVGVIQGLEPYGVGASTLTECLILQLRHLHNSDPLVVKLVQHDLLRIAEGKLRLLAEKYETEVAVINAAIAKIKSLNPKPGALYSREKPQYIMPDLKLMHIAGEYKVFLVNSFLPEITLNDSYMNLMKQNVSRDIQLYLKKNWHAAKGIIDSIERRKATLLKVSSVIFELQAEFCVKGSVHIRPMTMKQIAEVLQVHESTISRAISHKYIRTPWGLFELKHFFSSSIKHADGTTISSVYTKDRIREYISAEKQASPLSDQQIASLLQSEGLLISRRTVTKYREQMNLQSSKRRKKQ